MARIAIIGAGISGLTLAQHLSGQAEVVIFEKSRGPGGRMATRRAGEHQFDTGAQFLIARSRRFRQFLKPYREAGVVAPWEPKLFTIDRDGGHYKRFWFEPHFVGQPTMTGLAKTLANTQTVVARTRIIAVEGAPGEWILRADDDSVHGPYDWVVGTAPAPQSRELFSELGTARDWLGQIRMQSCLCALVSLPADAPFPWQVVEPRHSMLRWIADDSTRPGRPQSRSLVLHAHNNWSDEHFELSDGWLKQRFMSELETLTAISADQVTAIDLKRWRHARVVQAAEDPFWMDQRLKLGLCGDGGVGGSVESAFTSADRLARAMLRVL